MKAITYKTQIKELILRKLFISTNYKGVNDKEAAEKIIVKGN